MKIVIWTGAAWEPWGPASLNNGGIGGSETAAIHMGRELAKRGHEVVMVGDHAGQEGVAGQISHPLVYVHYQKAIDDPSILECDVLVSSRDKRVVRLNPKARHKILWVHDVDVGDDWDNDLLSFDRILALTDWHRRRLVEVYPHVEEQKICRTRNGLDPARFADVDWRAKLPAFVYSSSPDRGLDVMLDLWPRIKELAPGATLDIFYGFGQWRRLNAKNKRGLLIIDYMENRVAEICKEGVGVTHHGRVGQDELAEAHKRAMVWLYPTAFAETYCITALEAQAAGCIPITSNLAGLAETASKGFLHNGSNKSRTYQDFTMSCLQGVLIAWRDSLEKPRLGPPAPELALKCREWALTQTWASVAQDWESLFLHLSQGIVDTSFFKV